MSFLDTVMAMVRGEMRNAHKIAIATPSRTFNPTMVQRPVVGVGNAPQYWNNALFVGFNSIAGGGTIAGNPPAGGIGAAPLDWQSHTIGAPTQRGTLTPSRQLVGLGDQPNFNLLDRR